MRTYVREGQGKYVATWTREETVYLTWKTRWKRREHSFVDPLDQPYLLVPKILHGSSFFIISDYNTVPY